MITRKVQYRNDCFLTVIPKTLAAILGLKPGDKISFEIADKKIIITPACEPPGSDASQRQPT